MNAVTLLLTWTLLGQIGSGSLGLGSTSNAGFSSTSSPPSAAPIGSPALGSSALGSSATGSSATGSSAFGANAFGSSANSNGAAALTSAFDPGLDSDGKNYGWQINNLGELEYLIQISPNMLRDMQNPDPRMRIPVASRIPKELIGRIKRVVVTIGNDVLPRTPLSEVERLVPIAAHLPPGKLHDLEGGSIVNVANNNPSDNGFQTYNHSAAPTLNNQPNLNPAATTAPLGSFVDQARGNFQNGNFQNYAQPNTTAQNSGSLFDRLQSSGTGISGSRLGNTTNSGRLGNTAGTFGSNTGYDRLADNRSNPNYASTGQGYYQDPNSLQTGTGYSNQNSLAGSYPLRNDSQGAGRFASTGSGNGFGDTFNQYGTSTDPRRWTGTQADYQGLPNAFGHLASNTSQLPSTSNPQTGTLAMQAQQRAGTVRPDGSVLRTDGTVLRTDGSILRTDGSVIRPDGTIVNPSLLAQAYAAQHDNNYFVYVFFILSIAINLWMVHLLRSLYMRYRSLLSSLRSQSSTGLS